MGIDIGIGAAKRFERRAGRPDRRLPAQAREIDERVRRRGFPQVAPLLIGRERRLIEHLDAGLGCEIGGRKQRMRLRRPAIRLHQVLGQRVLAIDRQTVFREEIFRVEQR